MVPITIDRLELERWYSGFQRRACHLIEKADGTEQFQIDDWERPEGGGGRSSVLQGDGPVEKAAVLTSAVWGEAPSQLEHELGSQVSGFYATGVSIIVHPRNPHAPSLHANLRYIETDTAGWWFGGGADLTPHYLYPSDAVRFHQALHDLCASHPVADYRRWKAECDAYFRLPHRGEARGIGGIFFDRVADARMWRFQRELGPGVLAAYLPILERRSDTPYGPEEERWQLLRRGRYAEFNLVWDRGTRFGLDTGGRTESVLASLPPRVRWDYGVEPAPETREAELLDLVRGRPRDWLGADVASESSRLAVETRSGTVAEPSGGRPSRSR